MIAQNTLCGGCSGKKLKKVVNGIKESEKMIKSKELAVKVDEFLKRDIEVIDDYCDEFLKDLRLSKKHAGALMGLCQLCYAQGYVDCEMDKEE